MCALLYRLRTLFFSITQPEKRERHVHVPSSNTSHSDATSCDTHTHRPGLAHQEPKTKRESQGTKRHNACRPKGSSQAHGTIHRFSKKPSKNRKNGWVHHRLPEHPRMPPAAHTAAKPRQTAQHRARAVGKRQQWEWLRWNAVTAVSKRRRSKN